MKTVYDDVEWVSVETNEWGVSRVVIQRVGYEQASDYELPTADLTRCWRAGCTEDRSDGAYWCDVHRCVVMNVREHPGSRCGATTNRADRRCEIHARMESDRLIPLASVSS